MKVTYNWLKDYIKLPLSPEQLGEKFSSLGIAVETVTPVGFDISGVVVGQIEKIEKHPNADKLVYCSVNTGSGTKNIVCGATNMKERDKVPVALDGAFLPGDFKISDRKVREILSEGMMCSGKELGILEDAGGLLILPEDAPLGKDIVEYLQLKDWVYELEILPNRPDYLGTIGVARMLSAALKLPLTLPKIDLLEAPKETAASAVMVTIKDATLCPRYTARVIKGVRPGEAPLWMKIRLARSGIRPISNIVDITNYVLLEAGHPLHAFDLKLLSGGEIIVRRAAVGEELTTLDGVKRKMAAENLVIADADRAVALAGIMGGKTAEITSVTTDILLESAYFDPVNIRKTSKALNISTEASFR
ncbi:MAG: phenylalanine--tRNA ligase subunit beta, partial [Candidatus Firestonebacteria bacterium]